MSDDNEPAWYSPDRKPRPPRQRQPPDETLWTAVRQDHVTFECGLWFEGESWGWDVRIFRAGDFLASHRFMLRAQAEAWAQEMKTSILEGWTE
jgi:hypothetical protein